MSSDFDSGAADYQSLLTCRTKVGCIDRSVSLVPGLINSPFLRVSKAGINWLHEPWPVVDKGRVLSNCRPMITERAILVLTA